MSAALLTRAEWEVLLCGQFLPEGAVAALGTVMEVLDLAEMVKKGRGRLTHEQFLDGWRNLREPRGALRDGGVYLATLDQDCLTESLFEESGPSTINLWKLVANTEVSPARSVRRLILRPSDSKWWGEEAFEELERLGEEPGRNG